MGLIYPVNLANNTTADAGEVMQNFNAAGAKFNKGIGIDDLLTDSFLYPVYWNMETVAAAEIGQRFLPIAQQRLVYVTAMVYTANCDINLEYSDDGSFGAGHVTQLFTAGVGTVTVVFGAARGWSGGSLATGLLLGTSPAAMRLRIDALVAGSVRLQVTAFMKALLRQNNGSP